MNRTVGFVVVFLMGMPAYGAVPTLEQLSAVLKNFTFGFEIEFTSERSDRELEEIRDAFGFFTNELDTEKTGNREIRSVPVGGLEDLLNWMPSKRSFRR